MNLQELGINSEVGTKPAMCDKHGEFVSKNYFRSVWSICPVCDAEKRAEEKRIADQQAHLERRKEWEKKLGYAGIPERFRDRTLESYRADTAGQRDALAFAQVFAEQFEDKKSGRSAIFCGKPGTGKTHLAIGIAISVMELNRLALFTTVQRMVRRVKDTFNSKDETESQVINMHVEPDLLILDEVGVQFGTEFERNLIFDVLNERYEKRRATLLLSNLTPREVVSFLGERVYDRLREDGGKCVPFDWGSYRAAIGRTA